MKGKIGKEFKEAFQEVFFAYYSLNIGREGVPIRCGHGGLLHR